jgi:L-threonylcarbamoyladenylate synthase
MSPRTRTWSVTEAESIVAEALAVLTRGGLVALPTETVYGLAARADSAEACARIYEAKGRPSTHPLIVHVSGVDAAKPLVHPAAHLALERYARAFWPGPLTLVVPRTRLVPDLVSAGGDTVAVRCPAHPVMAELLAKAPFGLAAPSANRYQAVSPTTAAHVAASLGSAVDLLIDGGPCAVGLESTIVELALPSATPARPARVLRLGGLSVDSLRAFEPHLIVDARTDGENEVHTAPGRDRRHYAPRCTLTFIDAAHRLPSPHMSLGYLTYDEKSQPGFSLWIALSGEPALYARELYAALHKADGAGVHTLYVRRVPMGSAWDAVRDRLTRASS